MRSAVAVGVLGTIAGTLIAGFWVGVLLGAVVGAVAGIVTYAVIASRMIRRNLPPGRRRGAYVAHAIIATSMFAGLFVLVWSA